MTSLMSMVKCDCENPKGRWAEDHSRECELLFDTDFAWGLRWWDDDSETLREASIDRVSGDGTLLDRLGNGADGQGMGDPFDAEESEISEAELDAIVARNVAEFTEDYQNYLCDADPRKLSNNEWWDYQDLLRSWGIADYVLDDTWIAPRKCNCTPNHRFVCHVSRLMMERDPVNGDHWRPMTDREWDMYPPPRARVGRWSGSRWSDDGWEAWQRDRHYGQEVVFPDGTKIWASSHHRRRDDEPEPDFGLYMCSTWCPDYLHMMLPWNDFGLSKVSDEWTYWAIETAVTLAKAGDVVEIGCMGGHGRTGAVMAAMAQLCGVDGGVEAVKWVRANYCTHAVEGEEQEWFSEWFESRLKGTRCREKPPKKVWTSDKSTRVESGYGTVLGYKPGERRELGKKSFGGTTVITKAVSTPKTAPADASAGKAIRRHRKDLRPKALHGGST